MGRAPRAIHDRAAGWNRRLNLRDHPNQTFALDASGYLLPSPGVGFSAWITGAFANGTVPVGAMGPNDDPDPDGIGNLIEFAPANQDPKVSSASIGTFNTNTLTPGTPARSFLRLQVLSK